MGNETIVWGTLEEVIGFVSAHPATPSPETITNLGKVAKKMKLYVGWSIKEE